MPDLKVADLSVGTRVVLDMGVGYKRKRPTRGVVVATASPGDPLPKLKSTVWLAGSQNPMTQRLLLRLDGGTHLALPSTVFQAVHIDDRPPEAYIS